MHVHLERSELLVSICYVWTELSLLVQVRGYCVVLSIVSEQVARLRHTQRTNAQYFKFNLYLKNQILILGKFTAHKTNFESRKYDLR